MAIENKDNPYNLNEEELTLLRSLLKQRELSIENKTFFMTHSNYCFQVNEQSLKAIFFNEIEKYREGDFDYNYILYGCTKILDTSSYVKPIAKLKDEMIISPGNLFMHTQDSISFVVLTIHDEYESIETIKLKSNSKLMLSELISLDKFNTPLLSQYGYYNIFHNQGSLKLTCVSTKNNHKLKQNYELFKGFLKDCEVLRIFFPTQNEAEENKNLFSIENSKTKIVDGKILLFLDFKQLHNNLLFEILFEKNLFEVHFYAKNKEILVSILEYRSSYYLQKINEDDIIRLFNIFDGNGNYIVQVFE